VARAPARGALVVVASISAAGRGDGGSNRCVHGVTLSEIGKIGATTSGLVLEPTAASQKVGRQWALLCATEQKSPQLPSPVVQVL